MAADALVQRLEPAAIQFIQGPSRLPAPASGLLHVAFRKLKVGERWGTTTSLLVDQRRRHPIISRARSKDARLKPLAAEPFYQMVRAVAAGHAPTGTCMQQYDITV